MPRIIIQAFSGRTLDQKRELVRKVTDVVVETWKVDPSTVSVRIEEGSPENSATAGVLAVDKAAAEHR